MAIAEKEDKIVYIVSSVNVSERAEMVNNGPAYMATVTFRPEEMSGVFGNANASRATPGAPGGMPNGPVPIGGVPGTSSPPMVITFPDVEPAKFSIKLGDRYEFRKVTG